MDKNLITYYLTLVERIDNLNEVRLCKNVFQGETHFSDACLPQAGKGNSLLNR